MIYDQQIQHQKLNRFYFILIKGKNIKIMFGKTEPETKSSMKISQKSNSINPKGFKTGMYFPSKIICQIKASKKKGQVWQQKTLYNLTTQGFADIPISTIKKIKYYKIKDSDKLLLKIQSDVLATFFRIDRQHSSDFYSKIVWSRLATLNLFPDIDQFKGKIQGLIMKKSQILGHWQSRTVKITKQNGLQSYKQDKNEPSLVIKSTNEIWTRFQSFQQQNYLVIKLFYGIVKLQFGVPMDNAVEWLQAFCSLLQQKPN